MAFGRCPARSLFDEALPVLGKVQNQLNFLCGKNMPLEEAVEAYKQFEARKVSVWINEIDSCSHQAGPQNCLYCIM